MSNLTRKEIKFLKKREGLWEHFQQTGQLISPLTTVKRLWTNTEKKVFKKIESKVKTVVSAATLPKSQRTIGTPLIKKSKQFTEIEREEMGGTRRKIDFRGTESEKNPEQQGLHFLPMQERQEERMQEEYEEQPEREIQRMGRMGEEIGFGGLEHTISYEHQQTRETLDDIFDQAMTRIDQTTSTPYQPAYYGKLSNEDLRNMTNITYRGKSNEQIRNFYNNQQNANVMQGVIEDNKDSLLQKMVSDRQQIDPGLANQALQLRIGKLTSAMGPWNNSIQQTRSLYREHTPFSARDTRWEHENEDFSYAKVRDNQKMQLPGRPIYQDQLDPRDPDFKVFDPRTVHIPSNHFFFIFIFKCLNSIIFLKIAIRSMRSRAQEDKARWANMINPFTRVKGKSVITKPPVTTRKAGNNLPKDFFADVNQEFRDNSKINV